MVGLVLLGTLLSAAAEAPTPPSQLGPAGVLEDGHQAVFVDLDTELIALYPTVILGYRRGLGGWLDLGVETGGADVAMLLRLHAKVALWQGADGRGFLGLRLRVELKRQFQPIPDFGVVDDEGLTFIPELSLGYRVGAERRDAVYFASFYYLDVDVRPGFAVQHFVMIGMLGYEHRFQGGLHVTIDAAVGTEAGNAATMGIFFPRLHGVLGYEF